MVVPAFATWFVYMRYTLKHFRHVSMFNKTSEAVPYKRRQRRLGLYFLLSWVWVIVWGFAAGLFGPFG